MLFRIMRIFEATSSGWDPHDLYFVVKGIDPVNETTATKLTKEYLRGFKAFADYVGNVGVSNAIADLKVASPPASKVRDDDLPAMMYECLTDFLATQQPERQELFILKEALYSMSNDYFLMAYILWPAMRLTGKASTALDGYFELWRRGIKLEFFEGCVAAVSRPA